MVGQAPAPTSAPSNDDWPAQAADSIVRLVGVVRANTSGRLVTIARAIVYGLLLAILAMFFLVLSLVMVVRGLNIIVTNLLDPHHVWVVYLILGAIFSTLGLWLLRSGARGRARAQVRE